MIDEALRQLIEFLNTASPLVWQSLIKQVYIEASAKLAWAIGFAVALVVLLKITKAQKAIYDAEYSDGRFIQDGDFGAWLYLAVVTVGLLSFLHLVSAIMWFSNPEFYAIRFILDKLGGM